MASLLSKAHNLLSACGPYKAEVASDPTQARDSLTEIDRESCEASTESYSFRRNRGNKQGEGFLQSRSDGHRLDLVVPEGGQVWRFIFYIEMAKVEFFFQSLLKKLCTNCFR